MTSRSLKEKDFEKICAFFDRGVQITINVNKKFEGTLLNPVQNNDTNIRISRRQDQVEGIRGGSCEVRIRRNQATPKGSSRLC
jgi:hypothetical protein